MPISSKDFNKLTKASYKKRNEVEKVGDYTLDKTLSKKNARVYVNPQGEAVVSHTGTNPTMKDWSHNLLIPITSQYKKTDRYKTAKDVQKQAIAKYGDVSTIGHSQSGAIVNELAKEGLTTKKKTAVLNPAIIGKPSKGVQVVRSSSDLVSGLTRTGKKDITIQNKTSNPLAEHSPAVLSRINQNLGGQRYITPHCCGMCMYHEGIY
jgi:hypothetical protein